MGKYLIIKDADFSNVAVQSGKAFITGFNFNYAVGFYSISDFTSGNAVMVINKADSDEPFPVQGALSGYTLLSVPKEAKGVRITTVDNGEGFYHGVNLESATEEESTNALGWTRFSASVNGSTYMFPENFYSNGYKWLKCAFKKDRALVEDGDINAHNFKIEFLYSK